MLTCSARWRRTRSLRKRPSSSSHSWPFAHNRRVRLWKSQPVIRIERLAWRAASTNALKYASASMTNPAREACSTRQQLRPTANSSARCKFSAAMRRKTPAGGARFLSIPLADVHDRQHLLAREIAPQVLLHHLDLRLVTEVGIVG